MDLYQQQIELEETMRDLGRKAFRSKVEAARDKERETEVRHGKLLLSATIAPLASAIEEFITEAYAGKAGRRHKAATLLKDADPEVIAFITAKQVLDGASSRRTLVSVAFSVATAIESNFRWTKFESENKKLFNRVSKDVRSRTTHERHRRNVMAYAMTKAEIEWTPWPKGDKLHLGQKLVDLLITHTGLVRAVMVHTGRNSSPYYIEATEGTLDLISEKNEQWELLCPQLLPMVVPPLPWSSPHNGGYYHPAVRSVTPLIKTSNRNFLEEVSNMDDQLGHVYEAINAVQDVAWQVNPGVLEVMQDLWGRGLEVANLPRREDIPLPVKPTNIETDEEARRLWRKRAARVHEENRALRSQRLSTAKIVSVAEQFSEYENIYFPHTYDFRGRLYAMPMFLNPQGQDEAKGLLRFSEGKALEDERALGWLMIHGANTWGEDKVSMEERVSWVIDNEEWITACGQDPLSNLEWTKADSPWCFLAFCLEWAGYREEGYGFVSHLPIAMDGSCNGLQHFSAMLRDPVGGAATNLLPSETPEDIYQRVADVVTGKLEAIVEHMGETYHSPSDEETLARQWLDLGVSRKAVKRPVMVLPYGGTRFSCRDYIEDYIIECVKEGAHVPWDTANLFGPAQFLSALVWDAIGEVVTSARQVMDMLQQWARVAGAEGLPIFWTTPDGFPVLQAYPDLSSRRIETKLGDRVIRLNITDEGNKIDRRRQANGISPNFVHSLDAAALRLYVTLARENGIKSFALIHDSYGTLAADTDVSRACIRHAFVDMYLETDPLASLREGLNGVLSEDAKELDPIPAQLGLDLNVVRESEYFFA